jgi:hypothetical protein
MTLEEKVWSKIDRAAVPGPWLTVIGDALEEYRREKDQQVANALAPLRADFERRSAAGDEVNEGWRVAFGVALAELNRAMSALNLYQPINQRGEQKHGKQE